ncbi:MAG: hypothetical protein KGZ88_06230 [Methylomicrobium sp.]|nr:hypothetical protein [Methylomicrobium sp.]
MMRLIWLMMVAIGAAGCTQAQRFALIKNAELDECAMKRMAESKINGQHGYLQAHHECHQIVNFQKFRKMNLVRQSPSESERVAKDPLGEDPVCWDFVKSLYIDEHYPEMKIEKNGPWGRLPTERRKAIQERNALMNVLPDKLEEIPNARLIEIYELMAVNTVIGHANDTLCNSNGYRELESAIGLELKRRKG